MPALSSVPSSPPAPTPAEPIQRRKLYQEVMDRLVTMLRGEGYAPGDQIPSEREIMERFAVGRPAVREALQNLEWMGLITISHGERARVAEPSFGLLLDRIALTTSRILQNSPARLEELKEARQLFEVQMVRLAAQRGTDADLAALRAALDAQRESLPDMARFLRLDMRFHALIAGMGGNSIFPALSEAMLGWLGEFHRELVRAPGAEMLTLDEHARILTALEARDADAAESAMRDHILRSSELYRRLPAQEGES
jgi:DNA-binding FadR family transcriptional regulator